MLTHTEYLAALRTLALLWTVERDEPRVPPMWQPPLRRRHERTPYNRASIGGAS